MGIFNIYYKGRFRREEQLSKSPLQDSVTVIDDQDITAAKSIIRGIALIMPLLLLMVCYSGAYFSKAFGSPHPRESFPGEFVLTSIIGMVLLLISIPVHEVIHALCYPISARKEIYRWPEKGVWLMHSTAHLSRNRFVVMCVAPTMVLGVLPFLLFIAIKHDTNIFASFFLALFSIVSCISGGGDCYNVFIALNRTPKSSYLFSSAENTYATEVMDDTHGRSKRLLAVGVVLFVTGMAMVKLSPAFSLCPLLVSQVIFSFTCGAACNILKWIDFLSIVLLGFSGAFGLLALA